MGKTLGEMTPAERAEVIKRAANQIQAELQAAAPEIERIMNEYENPVLTYRNASQRRQNAIGMLSFLYLPREADGSAPYDMASTDAQEIAGNIRKLAQLGRTARWTGRIEQWARMIEENSGSMRDLRWAFLQGMIYATHAAE